MAVVPLPPSTVPPVTAVSVPPATVTVPPTLAAVLGPLFVNVIVPVSVWPAVPVAGRLTVTDTSARLDAASVAVVALFAALLSADPKIVVHGKITVVHVLTTNMKVLLMPLPVAAHDSLEVEPQQRING